MRKKPTTRVGPLDVVLLMVSDRGGATARREGLVIGLLRPSLRVPIVGVLIITFGVLATVVSGEYLISWSFLLIDIPLVAVSVAAGLYVTHRLRWAGRPR